MAKQKLEVNKSEEIRKQLKANPKASAKEVVAALGENGITVLPSQVYFIMGKISGRKSRRRKAQKVVAEVIAATTVPAPSSNGDAVKTILKVKGWAAEVGGMKQLKALVEALSE